MRRSTLVKIAIVVAIVAALLWFDFNYLKVNPESIRTWILSFGWIAPVIYMVMYIVRPFVLFPASVLAMAGGLAFGTWYGMLYTLIGEVIGAVLSFLLARKVGMGLFGGKEDPRFAKLERAMEKRGFMMVLMLRIAPFIPFDLVSYSAGVARVPLRAYLIATIIGTLPGTFAYNFLGASFTSGSWRDFVISGIVFAVALVVPLLFKRKVEREVEESQAPQTERVYKTSESKRNGNRVS
ncbi:TVP38/TMEM64 family protein [Cohnella yongneupensis]|uniref:TVP38/TMEM64 family membrane protein n=1 Tax=Cohnella yongneupensis TaxID=425006 RepID=A0ABW0R5S1_9BACL